jgi:hypothetical protein
MNNNAVILQADISAGAHKSSGAAAMRLPNTGASDMVESGRNEPDQALASLGKSSDITLTDALRTAITDAYQVFTPYAARFTAQVCQCPCCFIEADRKQLLKLPLREIDGYLLEQYSWSAHGHDNGGPLSDDLRYLLPRYFELFALNDPKLHDAPECNLTQLGRTAWRTVWPAAEIAVIDRYFDALMQACLANSAIEAGWNERGGSGYHCALQLDDVIVMLIRAGGDVARILTILNNAPDPSAALHLADMRFCIQTDARGTRLSNPHIDPEWNDAALAVGAFVSSAKTTARIETAFFQTSDPAAQSLLSDALFLG